MKSIYSTLFIITFSLAAKAANLTAVVSSGMGIAGKKGKITLAILGGIAPYNIVWLGPAGYSSTKLNPDSLAAGLYCVSVTDQYCGVAKLCVEVKGQVSGIAEVISEKAVVFPNPFYNRIEIRLAQMPTQEFATITLYDMLGKRVSSTTLKSQQQMVWNLDTELVKGIYLLHINVGDGRDILRQLSSVGY